MTDRTTTFRIQFAGATLLALIVWAFLNTPDQRTWQLAFSAILALLALACATALIAANFHRGWPESLARLLALLLLLWLTGYLQDRFPSIATWLASSLSLLTKKPVAIENMQFWLDRALLFIRWFVLPLLLIPRGIRFGRYAAIYTLLFLLGAVAPHYLIHWVPHLEGFWPEVLSAAARFLAAWLLAVTAWVQLGRLTRTADRW